MKKFEKETGKEAIWHGEITDAFRKWQKGEKVYNIKKQRISLYVPEGDKDEWDKFAKDNDYGSLAKLIRKALKFFIQYQSRVNINYNDQNIDLLAALSHELKEPLTIIKGYIQLITEKYGESLDSLDNNNIHSMLESVLDQCAILEERIVRLEKIENQEPKREEDLLEYDILLIEDDNETVNLLTNFFKLEGYSCKGVLEGLKGLEELKRNKPKLILLDILLPDISGYEVLNKIRSNDNFKNLPVFFLSAIPGSEVEKKANELDANGYILKPFNLSDFQSIFKHLKK
ncbi:MAG: response regulator [Promethearchaeota archaeon]